MTSTTYIYVIQEEDTGYFKVGVSIDPESRVSAFKTGNPHPLKVFDRKEVPKSEAFKLEERIHGSLEKFRIGLEWFKPEGIDRVWDVINPHRPTRNKYGMTDSQLCDFISDAAVQGNEFAMNVLRRAWQDMGLE